MPPPPRRRQRAHPSTVTTPPRIGAILSSVLQRAHRRHGALFDLQRRWRRLVGPTLSAHTRPVSLRAGRLVVHVDRPGEAFALTYEQQPLLHRLRAGTNGAVTELIIRAGELRA